MPSISNVLKQNTKKIFKVKENIQNKLSTLFDNYFNKSNELVNKLNEIEELYDEVNKKLTLIIGEKCSTIKINHFPDENKFTINLEELNIYELAQLPAILNDCKYGFQRKNVPFTNDRYCPYVQEGKLIFQLSSPNLTSDNIRNFWNNNEYSVNSHRLKSKEGGASASEYLLSIFTLEWKHAAENLKEYICQKNKK